MGISTPAATSFTAFHASFDSGWIFFVPTFSLHIFQILLVNASLFNYSYSKLKPQCWSNRICGEWWRRW